MMICPACAYPNESSDQCEKCDTVLLPRAPASAKGANEVARTLGVRPQDPARPVEITLSPKPVIPVVAPPEQKRRTWLLFGLFVALALLYFQTRQSAREERRTRAASFSADVSPPVDSGFLDLAFESMLGEAQAAYDTLEEKETARSLCEQLLFRVADFEKRLGRAQVTEARRTTYAEAVESLRAFVEDTLMPELDKEEGESEDGLVSTFALGQARQAFARAQAR